MDLAPKIVTEVQVFQLLSHQPDKAVCYLFSPSVTQTIEDALVQLPEMYIKEAQMLIKDGDIHPSAELRRQGTCPV